MAVEVVSGEVWEYPYDHMIAFTVETISSLLPVDQTVSVYLHHEAGSSLSVEVRERWEYAQIPIPLKEADTLRKEQKSNCTPIRQWLVESLASSSRYSLS